ncbi:MAG: hypothetical protein ACRDBQ_10895 [Shewanella sp.]
MCIEKSKQVRLNLLSQNLTTANFVALQIAFNESTIPHAINTLNTLTPSLSCPKSTRCRITQAHQVQAAKQAESPVVSKMQRALLAQLSPSAIHTSDIGKGYE